MKKTLFALLLASATLPALACSQVSPIYVLINQNDKNQDGMLSRKEWLKAKLDDNLVAKFTFDKRTFRQLDRNRNGKIDKADQEWYSLLEYKVSPCAWWEEEMRKRAQEENRPMPAQ